MLRQLRLLRAAPIIGIVLALFSFACWAQSDKPESSDAPIVGADVGAGWNILSIHWSAFHIGFDVASDANNYLLSPIAVSQNIVFASVQLPSGAAIGEIGVFAYDVEPARDVTVALRHLTGFGSIAGCSPCPLPVPPAAQSIATVSSSGTPGYQYSRAAVSPMHVVDNYVLRGGGQYTVSVSLNAQSNPGLGFRGVEIWWKRQISPAPAVASFADVPTTHQFFREIEALKEAGITLGCTATEFCPNASLTRAQMAAFLARALGLYWQY